MALIDDDRSQLARVEATLLGKFGQSVSPETISAEVESAMREFADARIRTYVPVLLQKRVTDQLRTRTVRLPN
jgi:hypothetical protein